jgi:hypothetical protein
MLNTYYPEFIITVVNKATGKTVATCNAFIEELNPLINILKNENPGCRVYYREV